MTGESRATCPECGRLIAVRLDGALRLHRSNRLGCPGGGINHPEAKREAARQLEMEAACRSVGFGEAWDALAAHDGAVNRMTAEILAAVAAYLIAARILASVEPTEVAA